MPNPGEGIEINVPSVSDAVFKYTWQVVKYGKVNKKKDFFDSQPFEFNANGDRTRWSLSIRYWKGAEGKRLSNPVVLCLNLLHAETRDPGQATVAFQLGVRNAVTGAWERCPSSRTVLNLPCSDMVSVGYRDLSIHDRHLEPRSRTLALSVKIRLVMNQGPENNLHQDLGRLLEDGSGDVVLQCAQDQTLRAHRCLLAARSPVFAEMLRCSDTLDLANVAKEVVLELVRYIYTDRVQDLDGGAAVLLTNAERFALPGLKTACERVLSENITADKVPSLLLVADQFNCELLKKSVLAYCEDHAPSIHKTMAWKVLEMVNPDLFVEVCEAGLGSSISSNLDSIPDSDPELL